MSIDDRSLLLLGEEGVGKIHAAKVAVFGLGGVGGTAFEALLRAGVGTLYAVDRDVVDESNLNRQILYVRQDIGVSKALSAKARAASIRLDVAVFAETYSVSETSLREHDYSSCDALLDCMDDIPAKVSLIKYARSHGIKIIVSLGMGNRLDSTKVHLITLDKTEGDPLAKKFRSVLREEKEDLSAILTVSSSEAPRTRGPKPASLMMVPSAAGLAMASWVVDYLAKR